MKDVVTTHTFPFERNSPEGGDNLAMLGPNAANHNGCRVHHDNLGRYFRHGEGLRIPFAFDTCDSHNIQ